MRTRLMRDKHSPPVVFYLAPSWAPDDLDTLVRRVRDPAQVGELCFHQTWFNWTLQTYVRLSDAGIPCEIATQMPEHGIVVAARCDLPFALRPRAGQFIACMVADASPHPFAQAQIVQNPTQCAGVRGAHFVPHWPQPGLIPRDPARGNAFVNIAYFGHRDQLAPELKSSAWEEFLSKLGLRWIPIFEDSARKTDFSDVDLIVAVRSFDGRAYEEKPASKLFNAWHAGVPALLGPESAFQAERTSPLDYLEVRTYAGLSAAVRHLVEHPAERAAMRHHAAYRASETTTTRMVERWRSVIVDHLVPAYHEWTTLGPIRRAGYGCERYLALRARGARQRWRVLTASREVAL